jgi:hypothetical protein
MNLDDSTLIEIVVVPKSHVDCQSIQQWFSSRGFSPTLIQAGLLVVGEKQLFESTFGLKIDPANLPLKVSPPSELRSQIEPFEIPRLRRYTK